MKRIVLGSLWFLAIFIGLYLLYSLGLGIYISTAYHAQGIQNGYQAGVEFSRTHRGLILAMPVAIFVLAAILAAMGTIKGVLPGTRKVSP